MTVNLSEERVAAPALPHRAAMAGPFESNAVKAASVAPASAFRFLVHRTWVVQHDARRA
ncbi:hypothetical protein [Streptomyces violaceus]|uniref:Uncharacterized protein n=1 Tax=Streptomyces violaceus TaxID=1936 RepID=A0ABY9UD91_STRVL|nr:hypothetical protein [Streptomyces janthinus]WND20543.1 hypothetical protein RI060_25810 [Streptomyces janthinus]